MVDQLFVCGQHEPNAIALVPWTLEQRIHTSLQGFTLSVTVHSARTPHECDTVFGTLGASRGLHLDASNLHHEIDYVYRFTLECTYEKRKELIRSREGDMPKKIITVKRGKSCMYSALPDAPVATPNTHTKDSGIVCI
jgi:hypothetical protein